MATADRDACTLIVTGDLNTDLEAESEGPESARRGSASRAPWRIHTVTTGTQRLGLGLLPAGDGVRAATRYGRAP